MAAAAQPMRGLVEKALDEPASISLEQIALPRALESIAEQTGVDVEMTPAAYDRLPYGQNTTIDRVDIANIPLRTGLANLFDPLGMTFKVVGDHVEVAPKPAIINLGRAPTWEELDTLAAVSTKRFASEEADRDWLKKRARFGRETPGGWDELAMALRAAGAGAGDDVLTAACDRLGWSWHVDKSNVVFESAATRHQRLLAKPLSVRISNRPLVDALHEIQVKACVPIRLEQGAIKSLPSYMQKSFSINVQRRSAERVLESVAAYTGLGYFVNNDGVVFYDPSDDQREPAPPAEGHSLDGLPDDPYVAKLTTTLEDGRKLEWLIRASELPPDLRARRASDLQKAFDQVRRADK